MERLKMLETMKETTHMNINYWKEIDEELPNILQNLHGIVLLAHNSIEFTNIIDFLNKTRPNQFLNILYISSIRSYNYMRTALEQKPLDQKRIFFIDCVSGFAFPPDEDLDECFYHKPPTNLEEMKEIMKFGIEKSNPDIVIVDSLSQFINFSHPTEQELNDFYTFLQSLRDNAINITQNTFLLLYDNKMSIMQNLPKTYTDLILKIEMAKEEPRCKD